MKQNLMQSESKIASQVEMNSMINSLMLQNQKTTEFETDKNVRKNTQLLIGTSQI